MINEAGQCRWASFIRFRDAMEEMTRRKMYPSLSVDSDSVASFVTIHKGCEEGDKQKRKVRDFEFIYQRDITWMRLNGVCHSALRQSQASFLFFGSSTTEDTLRASHSRSSIHFTNNNSANEKSWLAPEAETRTTTKDWQKLIIGVCLHRDWARSFGIHYPFLFTFISQCRIK